MKGPAEAPETLNGKGGKKSKKNDPPTLARWFLGNIFNLTRRFGSTAIWAAVLMYLFHEIAVVLQAYAGKASTAKVLFGFFASLHLVFEVSICVSGLSVALYLRERRLHRSTRERLTTRITQLEFQLDPNRTSSRLTTKGMTQKGDL